MTVDKEERYRLLLEGAVGIAIILLDTGGKVVDWSEGAERLFGYSEEEILGVHVSLLFLPEDQARPAFEFEQARKDREGPDDNWLLRKDGSRFWASGATTALRDQNGTLRGFSKFVRDISDKKAADDKIAQLNDNFRRLVTESHHRIKNNLQVLAAMVDMEVMKDEPYIPIAAVQRIKTYILTISGVHEVLTAHSQAGEGVSDSVAMEPMLERLLPLIKESASGDVQYEVGHLALPLKEASAVALLITELLSNACKHGGKSAKLRLTATNGGAALTVEDDGAGFPPDFDPRESAHTGLGLIESFARFDLRGDVRYQNRPEGGALVTVTFPIPRPESYSREGISTALGPIKTSS